MLWVLRDQGKLSKTFADNQEKPEKGREPDEGKSGNAEN
jgi:hypothetical protein